MIYGTVASSSVNHFADNIFKYIFLNEREWILISIPLKFVPMGQVSEWLSLAAFLGTVDIGDHIVHTSRVTTTYTLESLSSLT